ncbi:MAG: sigma-70 family RNA polymerase sigma factor [Actinomycetota bacterium]
MADPTIDQIFRTEWPRLVATLVRDLRDLELAEDSAQEAFTEAAIRWPEDGLPDRPAAWLLTTARRRAIDRVRRAGRYDDKVALLEATARSTTTVDLTDTVEAALIDDQLALIFGCCHPALDTDAQIALTLRAVAGLTTAEIARGFLVTEATMSKRLTRAKAKIRAANIPFVTPDRNELDPRLAAVLHVVYLIFTEGHASSNAEDLVRGDLCDEAIWLSELLIELVPNHAEVLGLAALVRLTDARREARIGADGTLILLEDQDRSRWNQAKIQHGIRLLRTAHETEDDVGAYTLQAGVAMVHGIAEEFDDTDWCAILEIYDRLAIEAGTVVVLLNRAIALSYVKGALAGLAELDALAAAQHLDGYQYLHSARGEMLRRLDRPGEAADAYRQARALSSNVAERDFLDRRLAALES